MTSPQPEEHGGEPIVRSGVSIITNAKGMAQVKVSVYEGVDVEEMERLKDIAVRTYEKTLAMLGARATFS